MPKQHVAVNERGRRIGESHPRAKLTDHEIDLLHELADGGMPYREIAEKFDIGYQHVKKIRAGQSRSQSIAGHRRRATP